MNNIKKRKLKLNLLRLIISDQIPKVNGISKIMIKQKEKNKIVK